jgi:hypothetical protein
MSKKMFLFICILLLKVCFGQFATDSIRVAHIQWPLKDKPLPQQFLSSAKANGYNYVLCEYVPFASDWDDNGNIISNPIILQTRLTQHFQQADSAGLRLIPHFQTGNPHAAFYRYIINSQIPNQLIHQNLPRQSASGDTFYTCHSSFVMSPDANNAGANLMNNAFGSLWEIVFLAFANAKSTMKYKNLDFVHLGYDENTYSWGPDTARRVLPLVGLCASDTVWLNAHNLKHSNSITQTQIQCLYAANIKKRVNDILSLSNEFGCNTQNIMIWADMFDPCQNGSYPHMCSFKNLFDPKLQSNDKNYSAKDSLVNVRTVGALNQPDMQAIKGNLILCPWVGSIYNWWGGRYIPKNVLDTFALYGYKVLYECGASQFTYNNGIPTYSPWGDPAYQNAFEFAFAAHDSKYIGSTMGYISVHWSDIAHRDCLDSLQGRNLIWDPDSDWIKPFNFMGVLTRINYQRTSELLRY